MSGVDIDETEIEKVPLDEINWEDEEYQVMPPLPDDEYNSLKNKIEEEGFRKDHPIIIDEDGKVNDGHHRCQIGDELGIGYVWASRQSGMSREEKIKSAYKENTVRRNLGNGEKREAAKNFYLNHYTGESIRDVAELIGVSKGTVGNAKNVLVEVEPDVFEEPSKLDSQGETEDEGDDTTEKQEPSKLDSDNDGSDSASSTPELPEVEVEAIPQVQLSKFRDGLEALGGLMQAVTSTNDEITEQAKDDFRDWLHQQQEDHPDFFNCNSD